MTTAGAIAAGASDTERHVGIAATATHAAGATENASRQATTGAALAADTATATGTALG